MEFWAFPVDAEGFRLTPAKPQAILNAPRPSNKEELQALLGLLNFYHAFLPRKVTIAEPLHRLLDKKDPWLSGNQQEIAFDRVKQLLASNQVLTHSHEKKFIILASDLSRYGKGAVLSHRLPAGAEASIAFYSRTLFVTERNYAQIHKDALAVFAGVKKSHGY